MKNALNWFEIPVSNMDRAAACYEALLGGKFRRENFGGKPYAIFPHDEAGVGGALVEDATRPPVKGGTVVYLSVDGELDQVLSRASQAGATVVVPKVSIGPDGFIAVVVDSEGNHVGFSSAT